MLFITLPSIISYISPILVVQVTHYHLLLFRRSKSVHQTKMGCIKLQHAMYYVVYYINPARKSNVQLCNTNPAASRRGPEGPSGNASKDKKAIEVVNHLSAFPGAALN